MYHFACAIPVRPCDFVMRGTEGCALCHVYGNQGGANFFASPNHLSILYLFDFLIQWEPRANQCQLLLLAIEKHVRAKKTPEFSINPPPLFGAP